MQRPSLSLHNCLLMFFRRCTFALIYFFHSASKFFEYANKVVQPFIAYLIFSQGINQSQYQNSVYNFYLNCIKKKNSYLILELRIVQISNVLHLKKREENKFFLLSQ